MITLSLKLSRSEVTYLLQILNGILTGYSTCGVTRENYFHIFNLRYLTKKLFDKRFSLVNRPLVEKVNLKVDINHAESLLFFLTDYDHSDTYSNALIISTISQLDKQRVSLFSSGRLIY